MRSGSVPIPSRINWSIRCPLRRAHHIQDSTSEPLSAPDRCQMARDGRISGAGEKRPPEMAPTRRSRTDPSRVGVLPNQASSGAPALLGPRTILEGCSGLIATRLIDKYKSVVNVRARSNFNFALMLITVSVYCWQQCHQFLLVFRQ